MKSYLNLLIICLLILSGCLTTDAYQKQVAIIGTEWSRTQTPEFEFEIVDTAADYEPQLLFRHNDNYPFSNVWVRVHIQHPGDSTYSDSFQVEIPLADPEGNWLGEQQSVNWTHRVTIYSKKFKQFAQPGIYKIRLAQIMRVDPLPGVLNVGWRVDKKPKTPKNQINSATNTQS